MNIIQIDENIRLYVPQREEWKIALNWYSNPDVLYYSEGIPYSEYKPYNIDTIIKMYSYLSNIGNLFFIQIRQNNNWISIGDATCSKDNMPIMICDKKYWGLGIGKKVLQKLIQLAKLQNIDRVTIDIYKYNERSRRLYSSCGFKKISEDNEKDYFELIIQQKETSQ